MKREIREMKSGLMTLGDWIKIAQGVFNQFVRIRDKDFPCISCGRTNVKEWHAGHYYATTFQGLRFNEDNVHKQCDQCNVPLRGNLILYREGLLKRIGSDRVKVLDAMRHNELDMTIPDLKELIAKYKLKTKELKP